MSAVIVNLFTRRPKDAIEREIRKMAGVFGASERAITEAIARAKERRAKVPGITDEACARYGFWNRPPKKPDGDAA